jgi:hypothetical protein
LEIQILDASRRESMLHDAFVEIVVNRAVVRGWRHTYKIQSRGRILMKTEQLHNTFLNTFFQRLISANHLFFIDNFKQESEKVMKVSSVFLLAACIKSAEGADDFNYRETQGRDYGPNDWDEVGCDNLENCVSYTIPAYDLYHRPSYTYSYCDSCTSLDGPTSILDRSDFN